MQCIVIETLLFFAPVGYPKCSSNLVVCFMSLASRGDSRRLRSYTVGEHIPH